MCLNSKWNFPKKAKKDIVCYKIVRGVPKEGNIKLYYTPYQHIEVTIPGTFEALGSRFRPITKAKDVGSGYIHAFTTLKEALEFYNICGGKIVESIIPKGTKYHISKTEKEICARKMRFLRVYSIKELIEYCNSNYFYERYICGE